MRLLSSIIYGIIILLFPLSGTLAAQAKLSYVEKALAGGVWQYDFTLANTASVPGINFYDFSFTFPSLGQFFRNIHPPGMGLFQ